MAFLIASRSPEGFYAGLIFGAMGLALPSALGDAILRGAIARGDEIFDLRRCTALSTVSCALWVAILLVGGVSQAAGYHDGLFYASILGSCAVTAIRYLAFFTISSLDEQRILASTIAQPLFCLMVDLTFWGRWGCPVFLVLFVANLTSLIATRIFTNLIDEYGKDVVGIGSIELLRGFAYSWIEGISSPLEACFERLGHNRDVHVALIAFRDHEKIRALMVVPTIHPGPFKNLGSSNFPYMIQKSLEKKFECVVAAPHGTSGHELNLTSQRQCIKALKEIEDLAEFSSFTATATALVRREFGSAKATCQFFGRDGLVTITCAPKSMEDVPPEIGFEIAKRGMELGARTIVVIDAHNSIEASKKTPMLSDRDLEDIREAASDAIATALREPQTKFEVGVAKVIPQDFDLRQGMGNGGIVAFTVSTGKQTVAYVIIDGNNMISGLRERIFKSLKLLGIEEGEVLTTDTHAVNALTLVERGYHPIGEALDKEKLISYVKEAVRKALARMRTSEVSFKVGKVSGVKVIGKEGLDKLSLLVDSAFHITKKYAAAIFVPTALLIVTLSLLLLREF